jgi:ABC-type sugar transport system ATPase subunit
MNFLEVDVKGSVLSHNGQTIGVATKPGLEGKHRFGVRPEFLVPSSNSGIEFRIDRVEDRGVFKLIHLSKDDYKFIAKVEENYAVSSAGTAKFTFDSKRAFLFDANKKIVAGVSPANQGGN